MIKHRAYSTIEIRAVDGDKRIIEGVASTPTPDRMNDVVEPMGAQFKTPLPLLWQHDSRSPIGHVTYAKATKDGIPFKAQFVKIDEPGALKDRLDEAWQSVKSGLVRAVSIGFRSIERSMLDDGGIRFLKWEWLELSVVTIPANQEATISAVKSIDRNIRAAFGQNVNNPGDAGNRKTQTGKIDMKTIAERIASLEAQINPKRLRMNAIMKDALDDAERDLNESEAEEFDELTDEVKTLDVQLARLKALDGSASTAKPASGGTQHDGTASRTIRVEPTIKATEEKGIGFARAVMLHTYAQLKHVNPIDLAKSRYPNLDRSRMSELQNFLKAQVAGGTTTDPSWAGPLVNPTNLASEFVEFLRPMTIVGRFGVGNIPALRPIPFNVQFPAQVTGGDGDWVGEGQPKPLTRFSFEQIILRWTKVANIAVVTQDLLRFSSPAAELVVRNALAEALQARLDISFISPSVTAIADVRPASVTNGASTAASSGPTAANARSDMKTLLNFFIAADIPTGGLVLVMRQAQALALSLMRNSLGNREFPDITMNGGFLEGIPVIVSQYTPLGVVAAIVAPEIYLADDSGVSIDLSTEASLEMADDPTNAATDNASPPQPVETAMVSMFQTNSVAIRAERFINWRRRRTAAVAYLTAVGWGDESSPFEPV